MSHLKQLQALVVQAERIMGKIKQPELLDDIVRWLLNYSQIKAPDSDNFRIAVANLADGCKLVCERDGFMHSWTMIKPVEQPDGVTIDRLMREGWLQNMPNGGTCKISDAGLKAYLRYTDGHPLEILPAIAAAGGE